MKSNIKTGKTSYSWVEYEEIVGGKLKHVQVVVWPNGEGFTIYRPDESMIEMDWDEWTALKKAVKGLDCI